MSSSVNFQDVDRNTLTGFYARADRVSWCYIKAYLTSGHGSAVATFFDVRPDDVMRLGAELLASAGAVEAEDIVEVLVPPLMIAEREMDIWTVLMATADARAGRECAGDYENKPLALAWLSLSEQQRAEACEAYLGAVQDRHLIAHGD